MLKSFSLKKATSVSLTKRNGNRAKKWQGDRRISICISMFLLFGMICISTQCSVEFLPKFVAFFI